MQHALSPTRLAATLMILIGHASDAEESPTSIMVWGPPGIGKSAIIKQVTAALAREFVETRPVLMDPVDLRGLPIVNGDNKAHWCPPEFLPQDPGSAAVMFIDELPQAAPLVQAAFLQLCWEPRQIGEYRLPRKCVVVAAGNRIEDRAGAHRIITPLTSRFIHLDLAVSVDDWRAWAVVAGIDETVTSFIAFKKDALYDFDPKRDSRQFPCPRTWDMVGRAVKKLPPDKAVRFPIVAGCVGEGAAAEYLAYCQDHYRLKDLPDKLLENPGSQDLPTGEPSLMFALCGAMTTRLRAKPELGDAYATACLRMPTEFGILAMRDGCKALGQDYTKLTRSKAGQSFLREHKDIFFAD